MVLNFTEGGTLDARCIQVLNQAAVEVRSSYNDIIEKLTDGNRDNADWWMSELSSRNTYAHTNSLFLNLCYVSLIHRLLEQNATIEKIITGSNALKRTLESCPILKAHKVEIRDGSSPWQRFMLNLQSLFNLATSPYRCLRQFLAAKLSFINRQQLLPDGITLIDTFVFDNSFVNGKYVDRYYTGMYEFVPEEEKEKFYYAPSLHISNNYFEIFRQMRASKEKFLLKEDFLRLQDWVHALTYPLRILRLKLKSILFQGCNIDPLIKQEWRTVIFSKSYIEPILKFRFAKRLKERGVQVRLVINWFENQTIDKAFNLGFNTFYPDAKVIGYQIAMGHKFYLCYYPTDYELRSKVLPKEIFVTGKGFIQAEKEFCPDLPVNVAPAFRYQHLWRERKYYPDKEYYTILLSLPITDNESKDILNLTLEVARMELKKNFRFWIKQHPALPPGIVFSVMGQKLPERFCLVNGDFNELLEKSDLVIGSNSSTLSEAIAKEIPAIVVGSQSGLTHNPIPATISHEIWRLCYTPQEILDAIKYFADLPEEKTSLIEKLGGQIREDYFEPVTKEGVRKFLMLD